MEVYIIMKKTVINENQRGFLFKDGKYVKMLAPGKYRLSDNKTIEICDTDKPISLDNCGVDVILNDPEAAACTSVLQVPDRRLALHFADGRFDGVFPSGKYVFWAQNAKHEYIIADISAPEVSEDIPKYIFSKIPPEYYTKVEVYEYQKGRLYFDKKLVKILDAGTYYFWKNEVKIDVGYVDTRLTQMNITGQEMLTLDKVTIRVNFVLTYRVTDYIKVITEIDDFAEQIHVYAQLAMREYTGRYKLDEILENKDRMSEYIFKKIKEKENDFFVAVTSAGVKDIILPGEIREIMNTVLTAEKRAQANVITRREEVASTRSLLNTAKLMDENKTLRRLKELEYIERICEHVDCIDLNGNIGMSGNKDILSQLTALLSGAD